MPRQELGLHCFGIRQPQCAFLIFGQQTHSRTGYDSDLNVEGWHDPVYRDHTRPEKVTLDSQGDYKLRGRHLEEAGLVIARKTLELYTSGTE